jgi:ketosteroid isomerase-like protein
MITDPRTDLDAVRQANAAFYAAFEERDLDAMSRVWEHTDRVVCTHPGWASLRGWARVSASFFALFQNSQRLQFILTNEMAVAMGDMAWVSIDENILDADGATTVAALNVFVRHPDGRWLMVVHHGSPVTASAEAPGGEDDEEEEEA